jgi:hypothetical protein
MFGVCGNEMSADGSIVDFEYGCGAHSDTPAPAGSGSPMYDPYDDGVLDVSEAPAAPTEVPAEVSEVLAEPSEAPADASAAPTEPTEPPSEPSEPPVEPS